MDDRFDVGPDGLSPTSRALRCPRCRDPVCSFSFSPDILCEGCDTRWDYEEYVQECQGHDTPRLVWVYDGKHTYTRLMHRDDLQTDSTGRWAIVDNKKVGWWAL